MKRTKAEVLLLSGILCMISIVLLLCGMSLWAETEGSGQSRIEEFEESGRTDVLSAVIEEHVTVEELEKTYAFVPIMDISDYYENICQSTKPIRFYSVPERAVTEKEAGLRGLNVIRKVFAEHMEGMYLVMKYDLYGRAEEGLWKGYLTDGGEEGEASLQERRSYVFEVNALTGEVLMVQRIFAGNLPVDSSKSIRDEEAEGTELYDKEEKLLERAKSYAKEYQLADLSGAKALIGRGYDIWENVYASDGTYLSTEQIVFVKGRENILGILTERESGAMLGYCLDLARRERGKLLAGNVQEQIAYLKERIEFMKREKEPGTESLIEEWERMVKKLEEERKDDWNFWE